MCVVIERARLRLSEDPPKGLRALSFAALWLGVAAIATAASIALAIPRTTPVAVRIVAVITLVAISTGALMLASDGVARALDGRLRGLAGPVQWLTTSLVVLSVVVAGGLALSSWAPDQAGVGYMLVDFLIDLLAGAVLGALASWLILGVAAGLGHVIWRVHRLLGAHRRADRWQRSTQAGRRPWREARRGAALGSAGLLMSAFCTALVTTVTTNYNGTADTPAPHETSRLLTLWLPVLFWLVGTGGAWLLLARRERSEHEPHRRLRHGMNASALSVCLVIAAAVIAAADLEGHAHRELWSGATEPVPTVSITDQQASLKSSYLARTFEPDLRLTTAEPWTPTTVTWYVRQNPRPNTAPPFCDAHAPGRPPPGCYEISSSCDVADPGPCAISGADDPALYYRYVDRGNASPKDRSPSAGGGAWTVIQYWVFYNYDSLHTWAITQWHQSDWEQVSVLVHRTGSVVRPVEVAFSEHCYGARLPAERVRWANGSHPIVFVARGSHANYPRPVSVPVRELRCSLGVTPRYLGVAGLFFSPALDGSRLEIPLTYLGGIRDLADGARPVPRLRLISLATAEPILSFSGTWGLENNLSPFGIIRTRISPGPRAPPAQGAWGTPFRSMLCNPGWLSRQAVPRTETAWVCGSS